MWYLKVEKLTKSYTGTALIDQLSFSLLQGQKVALVAKNGGGKSTLFKLIMGKLDKTDGKVEFRKGLKIWYLSQDFQGDLESSVLDYLFGGEHSSAQLIKEYERLLHSNEADDAVFQEILGKIEEANAREYESKVKTIISRLQLEALLQQKLGTLSGGELRRVALARVLIDEPEFLILDEPTNHLDLQMIEWLENYFKSQISTLFMITHDRYFLESVCNQIWELERGKLYHYPGNYSYFLEKQAERRENEQIETAKMRQLLKRELAWIRKAPRARATKQHYREKEFYKLEAAYDARKEVLQSESGVLDIPMQERRLGTKILKVKNLKKVFGQKQIVKGFSHDFKHCERVGIIGKNGVGKSTFINMLLGLEEQDWGMIEQGKTVVFGYYQQKAIDFPEEKRVIDVIRDQNEYLHLANGERFSASQLLEKFLFPPAQQYRFAHSLSGGEKRRLYLLKVLMQNPNFLVLDEPTNDLDLLTLRILEDFLLQFQGCLLIVSHDRSFMDRLVDHLFVFEGEGEISDFWGTYSEWKQQQDEQEKKKKSDEEKAQTCSPHSSSDAEKPVVSKLSYLEARELEQLIKDLEDLEQEKAEINRIFENKNLPYDEIALLSEHLGQLIKQIQQKEQRRFELLEKEEA